jgi:hypothetical protein
MKAIRTGPYYGRSPIDELAARHDYVSVRLIEALFGRLAASFRAWRDAAATRPRGL